MPLHAARAPSIRGLGHIGLVLTEDVHPDIRVVRTKPLDQIGRPLLAGHLKIVRPNGSKSSFLTMNLGGSSILVRSSSRLNCSSASLTSSSIIIG